MADEDPPAVYHPPIPFELGTLDRHDLSILATAAVILDGLPDTIPIQGGDIGGHITQTLRPGYIRHSLREIVRLRNGRT